MTDPRLAPDRLELPEYAKGRTGNRIQYVLDHGFGEKSVGPAWWSKELEMTGLTQQVRLFSDEESPRLRRRDLFELGRHLGDPGASQDAILEFLWHVLAWGTGPGQRGNKRRLDSFVEVTTRRQNVTLLHQAIARAQDGDVATAYSTLVRRGGGRIRGLGPAFFTKVLYFASEGTSGTRCLILDARVAGSLYNAGWQTLPRSRRSGFSFNWCTVTYESYCRLAERWAEEESARRERRVWPDEIERALFQGEDAT